MNDVKQYSRVLICYFCCLNLIIIVIVIVIILFYFIFIVIIIFCGLD